jgi:hypothetical protein
MSKNATGRAQGPAQKLIHDRDDGDPGNSTPGDIWGLGSFAEWAPRYKAAGWAPIPILGGGKGRTPGGVTGWEGTDLEGKRLERFIAKYGECVIATRAPRGDGFMVVGIDVDHYGDKAGGETLTAWAKEWGELPPTYLSTSREDGISGIRWFKVPPGWIGKANHPSVELVQRHHRQGVMPPSLHEKRRVPYRWLAQGRLPVVEIPLVADLPWLPDAYLDGLKNANPGTGNRVTIKDQDVLGIMTEGAPCHAVEAALGRYQELTAKGHACHDSMCEVQMRLVRLGEQGHEGVRKALDRLQAMLTADRGDQRDTVTEFTDALFSAVSKVMADPTPDDDKGCCPLALTIDQVSERLGMSTTWVTAGDAATHLGMSTTTISADQAAAYL